MVKGENLLRVGGFLSWDAIEVDWVVRGWVSMTGFAIASCRLFC